MYLKIGCYDDNGMFVKNTSYENRSDSNGSDENKTEVGDTKLDKVGIDTP